MDKIEKAHEVKLRWKRDDPDYIKALPEYTQYKRKDILLTVRNKVYEKVFLQAQKSKYAGL